MEHEIQELDMNALWREILRKCGKRAKFSAVYDKEEDDEYQEEEDIQEVDVSSETEVDKIVKEELPFEEILAEKRRKYTAKEEFIYLLYNDMLPFFVTKWDGYYLRKKPFARELSKADVEIDENDKDEETDERDEKDASLLQEEKEKKDGTRVSSWKRLSLPDEFANVKFYNDNSYSGRISRKMMEGEGEYKWHNGVQYKVPVNVHLDDYNIINIQLNSRKLVENKQGKRIITQGQFEQNQIQGKGLLRWNSSCWYEGDFVEGLRHGKGVMVDKEHNRVYVSQWHTGKRTKDIRGAESILRY